MAVSSLGLGSGLDIRSIVNGLVEAERQPKTFQLARQEASLQAKISSFGSFKSALSEFRSSLAGLRQSSQFNSLKASSSDSSVVTASVASNADVGKFSIESKQLAQANSLASAGFADVNTAIGTGTITIKFGTTDYDAETDTYNGFTQNAAKGTLTLAIDSSNNTLTGIRDAINKANSDVSASIVFDGSANHLVLTSKETGAANSLQISVDDPSLSAFEFNDAATNLTQTQAAKDAIMSVNGLDVHSATNTFSDTIKGVTFDLQQASPGKTITIDVARSQADIVGALQGFVDGYNALAQNVKDLTRYNADTKSASVLLGDATVRSGMAQIRSVLGDVVGGLEGSSIRTLNDLGLSTAADGTLSFDKNKFTAALNKDPEGVEAVFLAIGRSDNAGMKYVASSDTTTAGKYVVNVTQPATQGSLSNAAISDLTVTAGVNDSFSIRVDGVLSGQISLTAGVYATGADLAAEIQSRINGDAALKTGGVKAQVTYDTVNNRFDITSNAYGSTSSVDIVTSTAGSLGLNSATGIAGTDVAGTIGGQVATGKGQTLTGANGLALFIDSEANGDLGTINFSRGLMERLDSILGGLLNSDGALNAKTAGLQKSLDLIGKERDSLNAKMANLEARLLKQFNAMDSLLGRFQSIGSALGQQLAALPTYNSSDKK